MSLEQEPLLQHTSYGPRPSKKWWTRISRGSRSEQVQEDGQVGLDGKQDIVPRMFSLTAILKLTTAMITLSLLIALFLPERLVLPVACAQNGGLGIPARVDKILSENPLIDGHDDLAILIRFLYGNKVYGPNFEQPFETGTLAGQVDLERLRRGKSGGAFWSAFVPCPKNGSDFSTKNYDDAVTTTLSQLDLLRRLIAAYPSDFASPSLNISSIVSAFKEEGKLISPFGIEGLHQIGNSYSNLRLYESLGARYVTLTHNCHNKYADAAILSTSSGSSIAAPPYWGGVSKQGQELVKEMNRLGMLVDLSHVSQNTMLDVLGGRPEKWSGSASPVMFSHSSAYAICPHPRNVPDDVLKLVKKTNSIVMVNFSPDFISCVPSNSFTGIPDLYPQNNTLHQVARHITYIGDLIGYDHVGIGSDFDGILNTPTGLEDVSKFPDLVAELLKLGVSDEEATKIIGRNVMRVWKAAEATAQEMQRAGVEPAEDDVKGI